MVYDCKDYRAVLRHFFAARTVDDPDYSMRAFARDLGLTHAAFSQVFKGVRNFSEATSLEIADKLGMTPEEREYFHNLVLAETSRIPEEREASALKAETLRILSSAVSLSTEEFRPIAEWHFHPMMVLECLHGFRPDPEWVAPRLGITEEEARSGMEKLRKLGIFTVDVQGNWSQRRNYRIRTEEGASVALLKDIILQGLDRAKAALVEQPYEERISLTQTIPFRLADMDRVRKILDDCMKQIYAVHQSTEHLPADEIYQLHLHFFRATQKAKDPA